MRIGQSLADAFAVYCMRTNFDKRPLSGAAFIMHGGRRMDARDTARAWTRPYSSMQWAWIRALGLAPSDRWAGCAVRAKRRKPTKRELDECRRQRHGIRGV